MISDPKQEDKIITAFQDHFPNDKIKISDTGTVLINKNPYSYQMVGIIINTNGYIRAYLTYGNIKHLCLYESYRSVTPEQTKLQILEYRIQKLEEKLNDQHG